MLISTPLNRAPEMEKDKRPQTKSKPDVSPTFCASLRSRNAQWTCHKTHLTREFAGKIPRARRGRAIFGGKRPQTKSKQNSRRRLCASLRSRSTHDMDIEPFYAEIYRENAGAQNEHLDQAPALTCTMRTPQCGDTLFGEKKHWTKQKNWSNATFTSKNQDLIRYMDVSQDSSGYDCRLVHPSRWVLAPGIHRQYYSTSKNGKNDWGISQSAYSMSSLILVSHGFSEWVAIQTDTGSLAACNALYHCLPLLR